MDRDLPLPLLTPEIAEALAPSRIFGERHLQVLMAAMTLIGERGLSGASLRELARRVDMSQPSLYHYFESKDQLVEQVIEAYTARIFAIPDEVPPLDELEDVLRFVLRMVALNYERPEHADFVRFMFAVGLERHEYGPLFRDRFFERAVQVVAMVLQTWVARGDLRAEDAYWLARTATSALALHLIEHVVLLRRPTPAVDSEPFIAFLVETMAEGVRARARSKP